MNAHHLDENESQKKSLLDIKNDCFKDIDNGDGTTNDCFDIGDSDEDGED
ncbi:hypothetical protein J7I93_09160 [Bacillus sp. ISL-47]|nr:hypothetical protein [Bacillus sp. ISL-47]MBT2688349.1 hypothetical protein [Bacillus sp. ISL-47]